VPSGETDAAAVASHFMRAGEPVRAAPWWVEAAEQSLEANDYPECIRRSEAAEACGTRESLLARALFARAESHSWLGESHAMRAAAEHALVASDGNPALDAESLWWLGAALIRLGDSKFVADLAAPTLTLLSSHGHLDAVAGAAIRLARAMLIGGSCTAADRVADAVLASSKSLASRGPRFLADFAVWRGLRANFGHDIESFAHFMQEATTRYRHLGDRRRAAQMGGTMGYALLLLGAHAEAVNALRDAEEEASRLGLVNLVADVRQNLGLALARAGKLDEAERTVRASLETFARGKNHQMASASESYLSRVLLAKGDAAEALAVADAAIARLSGDHPIALMVRSAAADALLARGREGDAAIALEHARAAREALRSNPSQFEEPAPILRAHIDALLANHRHEEAARERADARAWLLKRAEHIHSERNRASFLYEEPDNARLMRE